MTTEAQALHNARQQVLRNAIRLEPDGEDVRVYTAANGHYWTLRPDAEPDVYLDSRFVDFIRTGIANAYSHAEQRDMSRKWKSTI